MPDDLTAQQIADTIAAMDASWNGQGVRCQCPGTNHGPNGCREAATVIVERHLVHECKSDRANRAGNVVELLCLVCAQDLWLASIQSVRKYVAAAKRVGAQPICNSCGDLITNPSDIVRSVKRQREGIR